MKTDPALARSALPVRYRIASPCSADWDMMRGDDRVRHCPQCDLNVCNLSAMTAKQVETLVAAPQQRRCVRVYLRADGKILTQDCPQRLRRMVRRASRLGGAALSALMSAASLAPRAHAQTRPAAVVQIEQKAGEIVVAVFDPQGAVVGNALVTVHSEASTWSQDEWVAVAPLIETEMAPIDFHLFSVSPAELPKNPVKRFLAWLGHKLGL